MANQLEIRCQGNNPPFNKWIDIIDVIGPGMKGSAVKMGDHFVNGRQLAGCLQAVRTGETRTIHAERDGGDQEELRPRWFEKLPGLQPLLGIGGVIAVVLLLIDSVRRGRRPPDATRLIPLIAGAGLLFGVSQG